MAQRRARIATLGMGMATLDTRVAKPPAKEADPHYLTAEHRSWRDAVAERADGRCQGRLPSGRICGRKASRMFADHIVEITDGGARLDIENGRYLCGSCHTRKTAASRTARQSH